MPRQGMADALSKIVARDGVAGLWRGGGPAVQRAALVNLGELATYDQASAACCMEADGTVNSRCMQTHAMCRSPPRGGIGLAS